MQTHYDWRVLQVFLFPLDFVKTWQSLFHLNEEKTILPIMRNKHTQNDMIHWSSIFESYNCITIQASSIRRLNQQHDFFFFFNSLFQSSLMQRLRKLSSQAWSDGMGQGWRTKHIFTISISNLVKCDLH